MAKHSLRKHIPILLVKYIHLSVHTPFEESIRKELLAATYSIFDLLSPIELNTINGMLDNTGNQYFKSLYAEYKKRGRWNED